MNVQEYIAILGKTVNQPVVVAFLKENGYAYPKKDTISIRAEDRYYWINSKARNVDLLCSIEVRNPKYAPAKSDKKGIYYPIVTKVIFYDEKSVEGLPFGLNFGLSYESLQECMGKPVTVNSLFGHHTFEKPIDTQREIFCGVVFDEEAGKILEISLFVKEEKVLFHLFDELKGENFETYQGRLGNREIAEVMFVRWAIECDLVAETPANGELIRGVKNGEVSVFDYLQSLHRGYVSCGDLSACRKSIYDYINNLNQDNGYYYGDFVKIFLPDEKLLANYLGATAQAVLDKVIFSEENYQKIKRILDKKNF